MANRFSQYTYDNALLLKAAGLIAASAAGGIIVDLGTGFIEGDLVVDVSAVEVASLDEVYDIYLMGSNSATFASGNVRLAHIQMGNVAAPASAGQTATGRFVAGFRNEQNGVTYRYARIHTIVAGTIATGINYVAFLAKKD